jgi:hypothetical protein
MPSLVTDAVRLVASLSMFRSGIDSQLVSVAFGCKKSVSTYTAEPRFSELILTEASLNQNACQALRFPELPAARHL